MKIKLKLNNLTNNQIAFLVFEYFDFKWSSDNPYRMSCGSRTHSLAWLYSSICLGSGPGMDSKENTNILLSMWTAVIEAFWINFSVRSSGNYMYVLKSHRGSATGFVEKTFEGPSHWDNIARIFIFLKFGETVEIPNVLLEEHQKMIRILDFDKMPREAVPFAIALIRGTSISLNPAPMTPHDQLLITRNGERDVENLLHCELTKEAAARNMTIIFRPNGLVEINCPESGQKQTIFATSEFGGGNVYARPTLIAVLAAMARSIHGQANYHIDEAIYQEVTALTQGEPVVLKM